MADILHSIQPDVIEVHNRPDFLTFFARQFPAIPIVAYMQNAFHDVGGSLTPETVDLVDRWVFASHYLQRRFTHDWPWAEDRTAVIHNAIDPDHFSPQAKTHSKTAAIRKSYGLERAKTLLYVGRLVPEKGIDPLLDVSDSSRRDHGGISC